MAEWHSNKSMALIRVIIHGTVLTLAIYYTNENFTCDILHDNIYSARF